MNEIKIKAMAKINLFLDVTGRRGDGYHTIKTVMQSVGLFDTVSIELKKDPGIDLFVSRDLNCSKEKNTAYLAAKEFFKATSKSVGIRINIEKNIPSGAGLAGGSADAAAVIVGLNTLLDMGLDESFLIDVGKRVGADVPFCIVGGTCFADGIGTELTKLKRIPKCLFLIAKPKESVCTKDAYFLVDKVKTADNAKFKEIINGIDNMNLKKVAKNLFNKFEDALNLDDVFKIKDIMLSYGAIGTSMTGSGSAVFSIFKCEDEAKVCEEILKEKYKDVFLCSKEDTSCKIF